MAKFETILKETISATIVERIRANPNHIAFRYKKKEAIRQKLQSKQWEEVSFQSFFSLVTRIRFQLKESGIQKEDRVAILAQTRLEWSIADVAILGCRAITVPIYPTVQAKTIEFILNQTETKVLFVENASQLKKVLSLQDSLPHLKEIYLIDASNLSSEQSRMIEQSSIVVRTLEEVFSQDIAVQTEQELLIHELSQASPSEVVTICYTSGTTGQPKGVMLTQENLITVLADCATSFNRKKNYIRPEKERTLSFLPAAHIFGKVESFGVYVFAWQVNYAETLEKVPIHLKEVSPTLIFSVPRLFEKAHQKILDEAKFFKGMKKRLFESATKVDSKFPLNRLAHKAIQQHFGGSLKYAISGGAPLHSDIQIFFRTVGIPIYEGYGLTETTGPVTLNTPDRYHPQSVGRPLPHSSIKIDLNGEILIQSRQVFMGYFRDEEETSKVLDADHWFRTGDVGTIDSEGYLHITDRIKDIIVTSGGKNIAPQKIEGLVKQDSWIEELLVYGDGRPHLTGLVSLDRERTIRYAAANQILFSEYAELIKNPKIVARTQTSVDQLNAQLAQFETIKSFVIVEDEFSVLSGDRTPSLKLRRTKILARFESELSQLY